MTHYLIDTENVQNAWGPFAERADDNDAFVLFYSTATSKINMHMFGPACLRGIRFRFVQCYTGSNGMDFQLATELGSLVNQNPADDFVIVSKDTGFDVLTKYWQDRKVNVTRKTPDIVSKPEKKPEAEPTATIKQDPVKQSYRDRLLSCGLSEPDVTDVVELMYTAMTYPQNERKLIAFNLFQKKYGAKDGQARYNTVKNIVKHVATNGPFPPTVPTPGKDQILQQIKEACPSLTKKEHEKVMNILQNAKKNKKAESRPGSYKKQLKTAFGKKVGNVIFEATCNLICTCHLI